MKTIKRRIVAAHIISADNKILFGRKRPDDGGVYLDCWHIPGGGVEADETDGRAIKREVKEETGLDLATADIILVDDKGSAMAEKTQGNGQKVLVDMTFAIYKVKIHKLANEIDVQESDDLIDFHWFEKTELDSIKLTPPEYVLFERIGTDWLIQ